VPDLLAETRIAVTAAGREIFGVAPETAWRWALKGVGGVRLESIKIGGVRFTSRQACDRFLAALNGSPNPQPSAPPSRTSRAEVAARKLDALGI
jgi:hypothetical protein